ncbi:MAG TPA: acyclic terpene utilization AtuA family protein [Casimicrobiaceae bacterium]|nr:acyclic terpene utilization AtuA family protein [Casimicrobiaceae bacterium]
MKRFRIGSGAGFAGDRIDTAVELVDRGELDVVVLECLAERTIALAQLKRRRDPSHGYDLRLARRIEPLLPLLKSRGVRLISNFGAANPAAAAQVILDIARRHKIALRVAIVTGDDVLSSIDIDAPSLENGRPLRAHGAMVSANAYLGADALLPALTHDADVIVTGRVADPSLFVAPIAHRYGIALDDWPRIARATTIGHLLECAGQLCGGYFADPGRKDVPGMATLGFPYADVDANGRGTLGKVEGTGGAITPATVKEQLMYEVTDPHGYVTPDVIADFTSVRLQRRSDNRIVVDGASGKARPEKLKVSVGYVAGFVGEGEIGYAGRNAIARAQLAADIVRSRLRNVVDDVRVDLIGSTSLHGPAIGEAAQPYEVRLRIAARARDTVTAERIADEVEALYTNGPAGGGGVRTAVREQIGIVSTLIDRTQVRPRVDVVEWAQDAATV